MQTIAKSINRKTSARKIIFARWGGEEFYIMMVDTSRETALKYAEDIRILVESLNIPHESSKVSDIVTISLGVTSTVVEEFTNSDNLGKPVDEALYSAKKLGRNRVEYHPFISSKK